MQSTSGITSIRSSAAHWSLAGDKMLLDVLQEIHQNMISKCEKTNSELLTLTNAIADADIALQTVKNRMMALSNSQFVESRVYDDEVSTSEDVTQQNTATKVLENESDTSKLKRGIKTLESMHEAVEIHHDSESDTDSDLELYSCRVVLKPIDVYADRPLPYIIGSHPWKSKWHAGLYREDSDSESESSHEFEETENILEEPHQVPTEPVEQLESSCSSEVGAAEMSQAEVAAALARRLAGDAPQIPQRDMEYTVPEPRSTKEYQPKPISTVREPIFFDEPPPLDQAYQSEEDTYSQEDDIFAELYKSKPNASANSAQNQITDDLFGDFATNVQNDLFGRAEDIKSESYGVQSQNATSKNTSGTFQEKMVSAAKPVLSEQDKKSVTNPIRVSKQETEISVKKPVGGISLFGNNEGAERIGAAILRKNQRESSTSSNDSGNDNIPKRLNKMKPQYTKKDQKESIIKENLIDNLFAKQENTMPVGQITVVKQEKKIDLFSDNLFDDVDDIFNSNVVVKIPKKEENRGEKSIFDDDDDLFADVAVTKKKEESKRNSATKKIFDSDDELFSDKNVVKNANISSTPSSSKSANFTNSLITNVSSRPTNIINDESDDDIFSDVKSFKEKNKPEPHKKIEFSNTEKNNVNISTGTAEENSSSVLEDNTQFIGKNDLNSSIIKEDYQICVEEKALQSETKKLNIPKETDSGISTVKDDNCNTCFDVKKISPEDLKGVLFSDDSNKKSEAMIINKSETNDKDDFFNKAHEVLSVTSTKSSIFGDEDDDEIKSESGFTLQDEKDKAVIQSKEKLDYVTTSKKSNFKEDTKTEIDANEIDNTKVASVASDNELFCTQGTSNENNRIRSDIHEIFSDSFDEQPPVFEKPKEPKKSKNINALFDDDSDDEALFFKSNDVDDKPEDLPLHKNRDKLFDIFHDEPPAFDIDFIQKPSKDYKTTVHENETKQDCRDTENVITEIEKECLVPSISGNVGLTKHNLDESDYTKEVKVGKLKLPNLNINVNTLLPGASPKKISKIVADAADEQTTSKDFIDKLSATHLADNDVKPKSSSISFEEQSTVLDNKFSKERAKIQVKRRPSTRRARQEAVRKSMVVEENNSTDNSTSFDISKDAILEKQNFPEVESIINKNVNSVKSKTVYILNDEDIFPNIKSNTNESVTKTKETIKDIPNIKSLQIVDDEIDEIFKTKNDLISETPDVGSERNKKDTITTLGKVYIDIKSDKEASMEPKQSNEITSPSSIDSTHDLQASAKIDKNNQNIGLLHAQNSNKTTKPSLFDDLSDDESELFGVTKAAVATKPKIFDSGNEDDLFVNKRKNNEIVQIKRSLFDNDDNDVGIFGASSNKPEPAARDKDNKSTGDTNVRDPLSTLLDED